MARFDSIFDLIPHPWMFSGVHTLLGSSKVPGRYSQSHKKQETRIEKKRLWESGVGLCRFLFCFVLF